jgi:signal peptidase I
MAEALTAETSVTKAVEPRRLHPGLAFLGGLFGLGIGYLYVGRVSYAIVYVVATYLWLFIAGWTGLVAHPAGWYALFAIIGLMWLGQLVHPVALAWSRPVAPLKLYKRWWWYIAWFVLFDVVSIFAAAYRGELFGYNHYRIPSGAMTPTVQAGDRIVVDTWRYREAAPAFGDIVVCDLGDGILVIKRVVGVPGDTIELRGPLLVRNGRPVAEPYVNLEQGMSPDVAPLTLGADDFFVVGDNRGNSNDSRYVGPIARRQISGRVEHIFLSISRGGVNWERFPIVLAGN